MDSPAENAALREGRAFHILAGQTQLTFTGADRFRYLNGQLTNLISEKMPADRALHACVLTAKGKLCGDVHVRREQDALRLDAVPELRESLAARLERYIIADDVEMRDDSDALVLFHVPGALPSPFAGITSSRFGVPGHDLLVPVAALEATRAALSAAGLIEAGPEAVETFRIENGVPRWGAELSEEIIPTEAGLDATAIDFHKGCYLGQEIISRIRSIGRVNKHLRRFTTEKPLEAGTPLGLEEGHEVGRVTSSAYSFTLEKWVGLGYVKSSVAAPRLTARDAAGTEVTVHLVPNLPNEDA